MRPHAFLTLLLVGTAGAFGSGCTTESFCFDQCEGDGTGTGGATTDGGGQGGSGAQGGTVNLDGGNQGGTLNLDSGSQGGTGGSGCGPEELACDGIDNDCDDLIDEDNDYTSVAACGTCANNCRTQFGDNFNVTCTPPDPADGTVAGTCEGVCAGDFYNIDGDDSNGCEYFCENNPDGTVTTDPGGAEGCGKDDDCDGDIDEDVDTCGDVENCGRCGKRCVVLNGTAQCVTSAGTGEACNEQNTGCEVDQCDPGFFDVDGSADNGCEYQCSVTTPGPEVCDGIDNDCDGKIDNTDSDLETDDPNVGVDCFGGAQGECAADIHKGVQKCIGAQILCCDVSSNTENATNPNFPVNGVQNGLCEGNNPPFVLEADEVSETCDLKDNDCDGLVDDSPIDAGGTCGSSVGSCQPGTEQCVNGALQCSGAVSPTPDLCNGQDDNCDGVIDGVAANPPVPCANDAACNTGAGEFCHPVESVCVSPATDVGGACDTPPAPPAGATSPCTGGVLTCTSGLKLCNGSVTAQSSTDTCGVDANCDGTLDGQPDTQNDVRNCGSCGNDCFANNPGQGLWSCNAGSCQFDGCRGGFIDCTGAANNCETACSGSSGNPELCNGVDDDCNCMVDDAIPSASTPTPVQVCNVSSAATDPNCTTNVGVSCSAGAWQCTFPSGFCDNSAAPLYCTNTPDDTCNAQDNNCNGTIDDNFQLAVVGPGGNYVGKACASDDGAGTSHGACRTQGIFECDPGNASQTRCSATKNNAAASDELCDGADNDCDGAIDETFNAPGTDARYVTPEVVQLTGGTWIYRYEASRPGATSNNPETGNGWHGSPPTGVVAENTLACSESGVVPWFNLTSNEVAQTCQAVGGRICELSDWQTACESSSGTCEYGYGTGCGTTGNYPNGNPSCNIGLYDFDSASAGIQDGLLPTAYNSGSNPPALSNCFANWGSSDIFDITGNLREISWNRTGASNGCDPTDPTDTDCLFTLSGGAYNTQAETGATCDFSFYTVNKDFKLFDTGFRCCFDSDPR